jgi:hypothetical protein
LAAASLAGSAALFTARGEEADPSVPPITL